MPNENLQTEVTNQRPDDVGRLTGGLSLAGATQSCMKCGKHRMMTMLKRKKLFGFIHTVCKDGCSSQK